ncbi:uncharacterized protein L969DRAFT_91436 [Mixia osmundae IAM 14324]|uniref:THO complex subunit 1 n=1 Tax=Mixia osmundae (strain CBS 9802 / IAM 14324 / JCM 22182 / KY 12970) TaxID=764103 RepID=G7E3W4_MIXOS|nr:uncharacterized protein L969DRAFT_91436 [Mixia osmundae IAM 14324]KEI41969.1 hypothetical protein L969DRAFT_91436 [Mixia osmundae IAM 14324]GAA97524.1 hypothetical protein E5Q_04202 [Mixia osmundae IAM 14324]
MAGLRAAIASAADSILGDLELQRSAHSGLGASDVQAAVDAHWNISGTDEASEGWRKEAQAVIIERAFTSRANSLALEADEKRPASLSALYDMLDVVLYLSQKGACDDSLAISLFEMITDAQTITVAESLFEFLESRREIIIKGLLPGRGKGLILLRTCNALLKRASKFVHTVFCGRILIFLAIVFPLCERSGVNVASSFNTDNVTILDESDVGQPDTTARLADASLTGDALALSDDSKSLDTKQNNAAAGEAKMKDLYERFWRLQQRFCDPRTLFTNVSSAGSKSNLDILKEDIELTLTTFAEAIAKEASFGSKKTRRDVRSRQDMDQEESLAEVEANYFFPKYLTKRNLLPLELADTVFRRQILVQILVVFQYLLSFTVSERAKVKARAATGKPLKLPHNLNEAEEAWTVSTRIRVVEMLRSTGPSGVAFWRTVSLILTREENWASWKLNNCVDFEQPPLADDAATVATSKLRERTKIARPYMHKVGNATLSRLWASKGADLANVVAADKAGELDRFTAEFGAMKRKAEETAENTELDAAAKAAQIDEAKEAQNAFSWRGLRLVASSNLSLFDKIASGATLVDIVEAIRNPPATPASSRAKKPKLATDAASTPSAGGTSPLESSQVSMAQDAAPAA